MASAKETNGSVRVLVGIAAVLALLTAACYGWWWLSAPRRISERELAALALHAASADEREKAAVELSRRGKPGRDCLVQLLRESPHGLVRVACIRGLAEQNWYPAMPALLERLNDPDVAVRGQAMQAVNYLLCMATDFDPAAPEAERRAIIDQYQTAWKDFKASRKSMAYARQQMGADFTDNL